MHMFWRMLCQLLMMAATGWLTTHFAMNAVDAGWGIDAIIKVTLSATMAICLMGLFIASAIHSATQHKKSPEPQQADWDFEE